jgi:hypothetical protein
MAALFYWDGTAWLPISTGGGGGGGGGTGPQGPPGADGISIEVYGPQPAPPLNPRKGDQWLDSTTLRVDDGTVFMPSPPPPEPEVILIKRLPPTDPDPVVVKRLPPTPEPVIVYLS